MRDPLPALTRLFRQLKSGAIELPENPPVDAELSLRLIYGGVQFCAIYDEEEDRYDIVTE